MQAQGPTQRLSAVDEFLSKPRPMLIGGAWQMAQSGRTFPTPDPATGQPLCEVAEGDAADVERAVQAARRALSGPWAKMSPSDRGRLLWRLGDLVEQHADELAQLETLDNGKPYKVARLGDVPAAADHLRYMAGWASKLEGNTRPLAGAGGGSFLAYTSREPVGVVAQIIPWNFPLLMAVWKLGPALACGCTLVLKPAEQTPLTALRLGELACAAGFPEGVVNIVPGFGETAGAALAAHPDVDKVAFTGSTEVGRLIVRAAAGNLKKVSLELGGKSPNIVFADADLDPAIAGAAGAIFFNQGETCTAGSRLFIEDKVFDRVVEGVAERGRKIRVGPGLDPSTQMGPLVSAEQLDRVSGYLASGKASGARALCGGDSIERPGYFVQPTVFVDTRPDMAIVREEIFGPVVTAHRFSSMEELVAAANDTSYGLAAGIYTRDLSRAHTLARALRAGTVWVNCYNVFDPALPFGGTKQSGWGREMGREVLDLYTELKSVCIRL